MPSLGPPGALRELAAVEIRDSRIPHEHATWYSSISRSAWWDTPAPIVHLHSDHPMRTRKDCVRLGTDANASWHATPDLALPTGSSASAHVARCLPEEWRARLGRSVQGGTDVIAAQHPLL